MLNYEIKLPATNWFDSFHCILQHNKLLFISSTNINAKRFEFHSFSDTETKSIIYFSVESQASPITAIGNKEVDKNVKGNFYQIGNQPISLRLLDMPFMHEIHELIGSIFCPTEKRQQNRKQGDNAKYHHITKPIHMLPNWISIFYSLTITLVTNNI